MKNSGCYGNRKIKKKLLICICCVLKESTRTLVEGEGAVGGETTDDKPEPNIVITG